MPGPEDLSSNDIACIMSEVLGKPIRFQQIPPDNYKSQLMQNGASEAMAQGIINIMFGSLGSNGSINLSSRISVSREFDWEPSSGSHELSERR